MNEKPKQSLYFIGIGLIVMFIMIYVIIAALPIIVEPDYYYMCVEYNWSWENKSYTYLLSFSRDEHDLAVDVELYNLKNENVSCIYSAPLHEFHCTFKIGNMTFKNNLIRMNCTKYLKVYVDKPGV